MYQNMPVGKQLKKGKELEIQSDTLPERIVNGKICVSTCAQPLAYYSLRGGMGESHK